MPSRSPTRQITDCGIWLQTLPALPHHPQTQIEQGALCSPHRNAERTLATIRFGDHHPPHRIRSVCLRDQFRTQARQPCFQALLLDACKRHPIHTRCTRIKAGESISVDQDVLATDLVVEQIEAEDGLRLGFAVELSLKVPDLIRRCQVHHQSPSPHHLQKRARSRGPLLHRHYPASTLLLPRPPPAVTTA